MKSASAAVISGNAKEKEAKSLNYSILQLDL